MPVVTFHRLCPPCGKVPHLIGDNRKTLVEFVGSRRFDIGIQC